GCGVEGEKLAQSKASEYGSAQGASHFGAFAKAYDEWNRTQHTRHIGHEDGTQSQYGGLLYSLARWQAVATLADQGKVNHHNGVFHDDAYQEKKPQQGHEAEILLGKLEGQQCAQAGGWQSG